jgi:hypothetical protein
LESRSKIHFCTDFKYQELGVNDHAPTTQGIQIIKKYPKMSAIKTSSK